MSGDYISREAAISKIRDEGVLGGDYDAYEREEDVVNTLKSIPAADVVEVVRCYECKYWEHRPDRQYDLCAYLFGAKRSCNPEDFCSRGERKGGQAEIPAGPYDLLYEEGGPDA